MGLVHIMNEDNEDRAMALREVRLDINQPIKLVDAFMGIGLHSKYVSGSVTGVNVDGTAVKYTVEKVDRPKETVEQTDVGTVTSCVRVKVTADGLYGEKLQLEFIYSKVKDKIYKQERPELATVELRCVNLDELKYPPNEVFVMASATFSEI